MLRLYTPISPHPTPDIRHPIPDTRHPDYQRESCVTEFPPIATARKLYDPVCPAS